MRLTKPIIILGSLFLAVSMPSAQTNPKTADEGNTSSRSDFYWNEKRDVHSWFTENEAAINQGDGCTLRVSEMSVPSSAVRAIASFVVTPEDEETTRLFTDSVSNSGLRLRVGVRYFPAGFSDKSQELQIALAAEGPADEVFDEISRSQASTLRYGDWKLLSVEKSIRVGNLRYDYSLTCENGKTFLSFLRHPSKRHVGKK